MLQKYFFSLIQLTPYEYGFRGYLHFFCTILNKNSTTTFVRPGGLCYKNREICHGAAQWLSEINLFVPLFVKRFPNRSKKRPNCGQEADNDGIIVHTEWTRDTDHCVQCTEAREVLLIDQLLITDVSGPGISQSCPNLSM